MPKTIDSAIPGIFSVGCISHQYPIISPLYFHKTAGSPHKTTKKTMKPQFTPFMTKQNHEIPIFFRYSKRSLLWPIASCLRPWSPGWSSGKRAHWFGAVLERRWRLFGLLDAFGVHLVSVTAFLWTWKMVRVQSIGPPIAARNRRSSPRFNGFLVLDFHRPKSSSQSYSYLNLVLGSESCWGLIKLVLKIFRCKNLVVCLTGSPIFPTSSGLSWYSSATSWGSPFSDIPIWAMVNTHYMVDGHPIHNKDPYNGYYKSLWTIGWLAPINGY